MEIHLSQFAGFCDGVKRAYEMVMTTDMSRIKSPVFVLGSLVHNNEVNKKIEERGIKKIERDFFFSAKPGEIGTVIITAHGVGPDVYKIAKKKGIDIIDTTCPKVIKVQRLAKVFSERGNKIILVGDKDHKEVRGINEWGGGKAVVISREKDLEKLDFEKEEKIAVLSQTTQNEDLYKKIAVEISRKFPSAEIIHTTCGTTHLRQEEIKKMAVDNDLVLIIGSLASANSGRLYGIAEKINKNSHFIEKANDIKKEWLMKAKKVGISAGASTPPWVIEKVLKRVSGI
ncbi:MAG TPA: 4-hydroxy-3-methylbut-2-enyl diphosphate reductase [Candidatus Moranbacteria bacterium]|nr:4-hydroxy-3-methylbut-2-enyl diphosphate reductase [Candidatus Moranbacteria bacterium]